MKKKLSIISNESIYYENNKFFCDNIDMKSIPEGLSNFFNINLITRKSKFERSKEIHIEKIDIYSNFFLYIRQIVKSIKNSDANILIISLTPYTFFAGLICIFLKKTFYLYIRSDGFLEYKKILGFIGPYIYSLMFSMISSKAKLITCHPKLLKEKKGTVLKPSQIDEKWLAPKKIADLESVKLLYVGRIRIEKGINSLFEIIKKLSINFTLTIVGNEKKNDLKIINPNIKILNSTKSKSLIEIYDDSNIFILPSFTEGYSQVVDESLSRGRPVIVFKEISDIVFENRKGVFVSNRDSASLEKTINHIMKNYESISDLISKNNLPTKKNFIKELSSTIMQD